MDKTEHLNIVQLPEELLVEIFSYLTPYEVINILLVSRLFKRMGEDQKLWLLKLRQQPFDWPLNSNDHYKTFINSYLTTYRGLIPKLKPLFRFLIERNLKEIAKLDLKIEDIEYKNKRGWSFLDIIKNDDQELLDYLHNIALLDYISPSCRIQYHKKDKHNRNLLHWATRFKQPPENIDLLISNGCVQELSQVWGYPLHIAAYYGFTQQVLKLADKTIAKFQEQGFETCMDAKTGRLKLQIRKNSENLNRNIVPINLALANGHTDTVNVLLNAGVSFEEDSLCYATVSGNIDLVKLVKEKQDTHQDYILSSDEELFTPLHIAAALGEEELVNYFLEVGFDVNRTSYPGHDLPFRLLPLHLAAQFGYLNIVKILLSKGAEIDATNCFRGRTSLRLAVDHDQAEVALYLLSVGADQFIRDELDKWLPIHSAAKNGCYEIFKALIEKSKSSDKTNVLINARTENNETVLHLAAEGGSLEIVQLILSMKMLDVDVAFSNTDEKNLTPLFYALRKGHHTLAQQLIDNGASLKALIHSHDKHGMTALHYCARHGMLDLVLQLLKNGMGVNVQDNYYCMPHHLAALHNHHAVLRLLIKVGARLESALSIITNNQHDLVNTSYLFYGINEDQHAMLFEYLRKTDDRYWQDRAHFHISEWKAIHFAAIFGNEECVQQLVASNINVVDPVCEIANGTKYYWNCDGTPLCFASSQGHISIVRTLINAGALNQVFEETQPALRLAMNNKQYEVALILLKSSKRVGEKFMTTCGSELMSYAVQNRRWEYVNYLRDTFNIKPVFTLNATGKVSVNDLPKVQVNYASRNINFLFRFFKTDSLMENIVSNLKTAKDDEERFNLAKTFIQENPDDPCAKSLYETIPDLIAGPGKK